MRARKATARTIPNPRYILLEKPRPEPYPRFHDARANP